MKKIQFKKEYWKEIHPDFTPELQIEWESKNFGYQEVKEWIESGLQINDANYAQWLNIVKGKDSKWVLDHGYKQEWREEFMENENWVDNLEEFALDKFKKGETTPQLLLFAHGRSLNKELNSEEEAASRLRCQECQQPYTGGSWCQSCNSKHFQQDFDKWTSGNQEIDELIRECQLQATNPNEVLEWIPYEQFMKIEHLADGGFSKVYRGELSKGVIKRWNTIDNKWERGEVNNWDKNKLVALKVLNNSSEVEADFVRESINHKLFNGENVTICRGISKEPSSGDYIMVMSYEKGGSLRQYLQKKYSQLSFSDKINFLADITSGLKKIHEKGLIHKDFHMGNILSNGNFCYITDLGLCRPASEKDQSKVYGVLSYVAPELLKFVLDSEESDMSSAPYSQPTDVYSLGIIAYELFSGLSPYHDVDYEGSLLEKINEGLRPNLDDVQAPQLLKDLISRCWDANPQNRPTASEIFKFLDDYFVGEDSNFCQQCKEIEDAETQKCKKLLLELYDKDVEGEEWKVRKELFSAFCEQHDYDKESEEAEKEFSKLLYPSKSNSGRQIHSITSRSLDFLAKINEQIREIESEINLSLESALKELIKDFIIVNQKVIKNAEDEVARSDAEELEKKLKDKMEKADFSRENIKKVVRHCEKKLVSLEKNQTKESEFQAKVVVETFPKVD
jgi:serine/threonine protein kinase